VHARLAFLNRTASGCVGGWHAVGPTKGFYTAADKVRLHNPANLNLYESRTGSHKGVLSDSDRFQRHGKNRLWCHCKPAVSLHRSTITDIMDSTLFVCFQKPFDSGCSGRPLCCTTSPPLESDPWRPRSRDSVCVSIVK
jgi:hypothetical protein